MTEYQGFRAKIGPFFVFSGHFLMSKSLIPAQDRPGQHPHDNSGNRIRRVDSSGIITTVAGDGNIYFSGDSGPADQTSIGRPESVAVDGFGNLYISESFSHRVFKVNSSGIIKPHQGRNRGRRHRRVGLYLRCNRKASDRNQGRRTGGALRI